MRRTDDKLRQADDLAVLILAQVQQLREEIAGARHDLASEIETPELYERGSDG